MINTNYYPAKILLFGEYSVVLKGDALAIPWKQKKGVWRQGSFVDAKPLLPLLYHLKKQHINFLNLDKFYSDIMQGYFLGSNIDFQKGLGSSASLVAAIFDKYKSAETSSVSELVHFFGQLESYYHGQSSGFDPFVPFYKKPICKVEDHIEIIDHSNLKLQQFFLLDSQISRNNKSLIPETIHYLKQHSKIREDYIQLQNNAIHKFLNDQDMAEAFKQISHFQIKHLQSLIPASLLEIWQKGLQEDHFYLKLCGAGGGGYFLGYLNQSTLNSLPFNRENVFSLL